MELMEPDGSLGGFAESGKFEIPDIAYQQLSRVYHTIGFSGGDEYPLPPTHLLCSRLRQSKLSDYPETRSFRISVFIIG
ncbi:MAG: hypothetical protein DME71_00670 [Verrucomicrobia bacterium]|nr:MAG: hypothetical protein DME92_01720 [Verrucomicrobiota bacterium]PYJ91920.1 MAG: hypothetical protein DME71_00670 [Verrucomicrobiota bacterium]